MKKTSLVIIPSLIIVLLFFLMAVLRAILVGSGAIHDGQMQSFGVCSDGTILVGYRDAIEVYQDKSLAFTFKPPTSRAYRFYVENDTLVIGCAAGYTKVYDAKGNFIEDSELSYNAVKSKANKIKYKTEDGEEYKVYNSFGLNPFEIRLNHETIIQETTLNYCFNGFPFWLFWAIAFINFVIVVFFLIEKFAIRK